MPSHMNYNVLCTHITGSPTTNCSENNNISDLLKVPAMSMHLCVLLEELICLVSKENNYHVCNAHGCEMHMGVK